jgi:zinc/manganese transport system substrate-binding protein
MRLRPGSLLTVLFFATSPSFLQASPVKVVAAENFYGDVVAQVGGSLVEVTSILSDPNLDPHEYESNVATAKKLAQADLLVENSGGYDDWMDKLAAASGKPRRIVKAFDVATDKLPGNEHVWYQPRNVEAVARAVAAQLKAIRPSDGPTVDANLQGFLSRLQAVKAKLEILKEKLSGTPVALTETLFLYQSVPLGLQVITPYEFQKAVAEGDKPPATAALAAERQIQQKLVKVLILNAQTTTPTTAKLVQLAKTASIPVVSITETMPPGETYQTWMLRQLADLESALTR